MGNFECACCGEKTLEHEDFYERCPNCGWVDDLLQRTKPDYDKCANDMSLNQAKEAFKKGEKIK